MRKGEIDLVVVGADRIAANGDTANKIGTYSVAVLAKEHGIRRPEQLSTVQKYSMACPAIPTCGLALSESERTLPTLIDD